MPIGDPAYTITTKTPLEVVLVDSSQKVMGSPKMCNPCLTLYDMYLKKFILKPSA